MVKVGDYNKMKVIRQVDFGVYLDDGQEGILLPKRYVPAGTAPGAELDVFVYYDSDDRLIATTQHPKGKVGDIVPLRVVSITPHGAFLDWGLMKDLFVPKSKQLTGMRLHGLYIVRIYLDEQTGRITATEKVEPFLSNEPVTVKEKEIVDLLIYRRTDIGYVAIINKLHTGVLHFSDIYRTIQVGDEMKGFVKGVLPENKIDVALGTPGYDRVNDASEKILQLLRDNDGYLPYNDQSKPEDVYSFFGMSKKTFKMTTGGLYKSHKIMFTQTGIKLLDT